MTALPNARRSLRLIEGGADYREDEARIEALVFFSEVARDAHAIHSAELSRDVPSMVVLNLAGRMATRATRAHREYLDLGGDAA